MPKAEGETLSYVAAEAGLYPLKVDEQIVHVLYVRGEVVDIPAARCLPNEGNRRIKMLVNPLLYLPLLSG
jgi:hypothetical protein